MTLAELVAILKSQTQPLSACSLKGHLNRLVLKAGELAPYVRFDRSRYSRNAIDEGRHFQMLLICWCRGQCSPIHDHAGSGCGVRVISGRAKETLYDVSDPTRPEVVHRHVLRPPAVTTSFDRDAHRIIALDDLITLHVYSPPLRSMTIFPEKAPVPQLLPV